MLKRRFNPRDEEDRLTFIFYRDGFIQAQEFTHSLIKIYLEASLKTRQKFNTRSYPYRRAYLESAYSARHLLRTKFLESLDRVA